VGNTGLMKRKRPELVGVTQVKQGSHRDAIACYRKGVFVDSKNKNKTS
jgi:hypothetical protein